MKMHLVALVGLVISFAVPAFAQQTNTRDPQLREALVAYCKKEDEAWNNNDAVALAALYTEDAVEVTDTGPIYGRKALEKHWADVFQKVHFSNHLITPDQYSPHTIDAAGHEVWATGEWSLTVKGENFGPVEAKGHWGAIKVREGDSLKTLMDTWNVIPAAAATPSPTTTPSNQ